MFCMAIEKKLLIGRHGLAPQKPEGGSYDTLMPEAFPPLYKYGSSLRDFVAEHNLRLGDSFLTHSTAQRTRYSGQTALIGAFNLQPSSGQAPPQCQEDLEEYDLSELISREDTDFSMGTPFCNSQIYKNEGPVPIIDYWLQNPDATEHFGEAIQSGRSLLQRTTQLVLSDARRLLNGDYCLGVMVSHTSLVEPPIISLINSCLCTPITSVKDIGGEFLMGEFSELLLLPTGNGSYESRLTLKGETYPVNLEKLGKI